MREDLDAALCRDFPLLYRDRNRSMTETCMYWGFCVGDGWEPAIRRLSEKLEPLIAALPDDENRPVAAQVKEKFGQLRFYLDGGTEEMTRAIQEAYDETDKTCEDCGAPGERRGGGWIQTLCGPCAAPVPRQSTGEGSK
jgi:hypothetical protein